MAQMAKKLFVDKIITIFLEVHTKNQSKMNYRWSSHDLLHFKDNKWDDYYLETTIKRKIKTKNYECYESNDMEQTKCLDDFYMSKLNCSFPWIESTMSGLGVDRVEFSQTLLIALL